MPLDGDMEKLRRFVLASGMNGSALEHSVPEQMFSTPDNPAEGVSAVKALKLANDQGIPIYTINQSNIDTILPQLQVDPDVKADIVNAVNAGKVVTVSKTNITFNGWTGCGYIIIDPTTGNGAYMISGGMRGGIIIGTLLTILAGVFLILAVMVAPETGGIGSLILVYLGFINLYGALIAFYGKIAADEFVECISEIFGIHIAFDSIEHFLNNFLKRIGLVLIIYHGISSFKKCLEGLYGHLFEGASILDVYTKLERNEAYAI
jgi:hypothetical protein